MRALLRLGEVCHFTIAPRQSAFDSPMLLVGAFVLLPMRAFGNWLPYMVMPCSTGQHREDSGGEPGTSGNFSCSWMTYRLQDIFDFEDTVVLMSTLNYSTLEPRDGKPLHKFGCQGISLGHPVTRLPLRPV